MTNDRANRRYPEVVVNPCVQLPVTSAAATYELGVEEVAHLRVLAAFNELTLAI